MKVVSVIRNEPTLPLSSAQIGQVVRLQGFRYEDCLKGTDGACFYMRVRPTGPEKTGRVTLVSLDGALTRELDEMVHVYIHTAETAVYPSEK